ncbi:cyclic nucleotide-binding domain-containing protein [bacterium]|nr:cyclic nucleotide-binding domain-containing protein [bacterium]
MSKTDPAQAMKKHPKSEVLKRLSRIEILRALPAEEILSLVPFVEQLPYSAGTVLMSQGELGDALYFIEQGLARVHRTDSPDAWHVGAGSVVGEIALLTGDKRTATVTAETDMIVWKINKDSFDVAVAESPELKRALEELMVQRLKGIAVTLPKKNVWLSTAMRALEAQYRGITMWQRFMGIGMIMWAMVLYNDLFPVISVKEYEIEFAVFQLICGMFILQGSCEGFIIGVERIGARYKWDGFISGTVGSMLSTLPEFVVIAFLILIDPLAAYVTTIITIFNNALAYSIYSFFLPKDHDGCYTMPRSLTRAGGELLIAGSAVTLIIGIVMLVMRVEMSRTTFEGFDLILIGIILIVIYGYYVLMLVRYYGEGKDDAESVPPDPENLGHDTSWNGIATMFLLGVFGAYCGGDSIGGFAETALNSIGLPTVPTAALLALFAGISEYIIVYKAHRRGELGIALSNVFGGLTQVMFLLLPFALLLIGISGLVTGNAIYSIPINITTCLLMLLLFPLFHTLHQYLEQEKSVNNLDAASMTGIYVLLLYFLFTYTN